MLMMSDNKVRFIRFNANNLKTNMKILTFSEANRYHEIGVFKYAAYDVSSFAFTHKGDQPTSEWRISFCNNSQPGGTVNSNDLRGYYRLEKPNGKYLEIFNISFH